MDLWWLTRVLFSLSHARLWVRWAPGIPHALCWAEVKCATRAFRAARMWSHILPSFRGDAKHRTRNLEIPGLVLTHHPGMTASACRPVFYPNPPLFFRLAPRRLCG